MKDNKVIIHDILNEYIKITEASSSSISAGIYNGPIELGLKKWKESLEAEFSTNDHPNYLLLVCALFLMRQQQSAQSSAAAGGLGG